MDVSRVVNTHVHVPPNFSAFATPEAVIAAAVAAGVVALGVSNFFDQRVYARIGELAAGTGVLPLYGVEFITWVPEFEAAGVRVNDPANPGRMYVTGKAIDPNRTPSPRAARIAAQVRAANDARAAVMVERVAAYLAGLGVPLQLDAGRMAAAVARRAGVPVEWVSLQERHIAAAVHAGLLGLPEGERAWDRIGARADITDPVAAQTAIRARLLKAGTPGFAPEVPLGFDDGYGYILDRGGIPCYPVLADGTDPVCPFEADPAGLAEALLARGIHAAELIPARNHAAVVDAYSAALTAAGLIVLAGTEHNTPETIPLDPACTDGPLSAAARQAVWEGTCVVVAHAARVARGAPGFVDAAGRPATPRDELIAEGNTALLAAAKRHEN